MHGEQRRQDGRDDRGAAVHAPSPGDEFPAVTGDTHDAEREGRACRHGERRDQGQGDCDLAGNGV